MLITDIFGHRMTKNLGLVLISSSLILNGCAHHSPTQNEKQEGEPQTMQPVGPHWWYFHHGGTYSGSSFHPGTTSHSGGVTSSSGFRSGSGGFKASPSVSSRGGFGASGHAFGSSGA